MRERRALYERGETTESKSIGTEKGQGEGALWMASALSAGQELMR